jgi:hypothetical protein
MAVPHAQPASLARIGDLLVLEEAGARFVIACDSVGGIGPKPADTVAVDARTTGHFATRVPLMEVLCAGATPLVVVDNLCVESEPTGREMIEAVRELALSAGVGAGGVTGSTEDNVPTRATGIGVTVIGRMGSTTRHGSSLPGDAIVCLGLPRSAPEDDLYIGRPDLVDLGGLRTALASDLIHDALPVGSKGIRWEAGLMARSAGLALRWNPEAPVPLDKSGGPSSCVLVSCVPGDVPRFGEFFADTMPITVVGLLAEAMGP